MDMLILASGYSAFGPDQGEDGDRMPQLTKLHEDLARIVVADRDLNDVLAEVTTIARRAMPGCDAASITLIRGEKAYTAAHDGQMALDADEMQYERGYGPCLDAGRAGQVFLVEDMAVEDRWPDYARHAAANGVGSSLSVPLPFQSATIGALNSYAAKTHAFGEEERALAEDVASWIAVAVGNADAAVTTRGELAQLRTAMLSRAVIEQAKGRLMERHGIDEDAAFTLLTHTSQNSNVKLRDVAAEIVRTGRLPSGS
jgi:GAF domain-containing protein